eukprot:2673732-Amphidinium_carterae.2
MKLRVVVTTKMKSSTCRIEVVVYFCCNNVDLDSDVKVWRSPNIKYVPVAMSGSSLLLLLLERLQMAEVGGTVCRRNTRCILCTSVQHCCCFVITVLKNVEAWTAIMKSITSCHC